jgi:hypothetical protein
MNKRYVKKKDQSIIPKRSKYEEAHKSKELDNRRAHFEKEPVRVAQHAEYAIFRVHEHALMELQGFDGALGSTGFAAVPGY